MRNATQWTNGCGIGASGSSTISTNSFVDAGAPLHCRGGETFPPSALWVSGSAVPLPNAALATESGAAGDLPPPSACFAASILSVPAVLHPVRTIPSSGSARRYKIGDRRFMTDYLARAGRGVQGAGQLHSRHVL